MKLKQTAFLSDLKCQWGAYHNEWGFASGRMITHTWKSYKDVEKWIKDSKPSSGYYIPLPYPPEKILIKLLYNE